MQPVALRAVVSLLECSAARSTERAHLEGGPVSLLFAVQLTSINHEKSGSMPKCVDWVGMVTKVRRRWQRLSHAVNVGTLTCTSFTERSSLSARLVSGFLDSVVFVVALRTITDVFV